jgi:sulfide dehydrogenase cytochrome subunit
MDVNGRARRRRGALMLASIGMLGVLQACGGGGSNSDADPTAGAASAAHQQALASGRTREAASTIAQPGNTEGRLLASNCFQCHGTLGLGGFDKIRGSEASEVMEFLTKPASKDIMAAHAQGYTPEQLKKIIAYLQQ